MTQTMRERLIEKARARANATHLEKRDWREEDVEEIGGEPIINLAEIVDALLAELRERDKPMILAGLDSFKLAMAEEPRPGILADAFTAMIDAVREGR